MRETNKPTIVMKKILISFTVIVLLIAISHTYFTITYKRSGNELTERFKKDPDCEAFIAAFPKFHTTSKKLPKAVLLLHGYASSPDFFKFLAPELEKNNIPYYAPLLTGFGLTNYHMLDVVQDFDWIRDAIFSYNLLSAIAEDIIVLGHSNGGCVATILSSIKPINHIILVDPYIYSDVSANKALKILKPILENKLGNKFLGMAYPYSSNIFEQNNALKDNWDLDPKTSYKYFSYPLNPTSSIYTLLHEQKKAQKTLRQFKSPQTAFKPKHIYLLYGAKDQTADINKLIEFFKDYPIKHSIYSFPNSGHDLLVDFDSKKAIEQIIEIIKKS